MLERWKANRIWSLDILRGFLIALMTLGHTIYFVHGNSLPLLAGIDYLSNLISFTGFLFVSGAVSYTNVFKAKNGGFLLFKKLVRLFVYLLGYYLIALWINFVIEGWSTQALWKILSFQKLIPFTEFLVPLLLFGFLKFPLQKVWEVVKSRLWLVILIGIGSYLLGSILYFVNLPWIPDAWKAIWVGYPGYYSFPVLQYLGIYLLGMWMGAEQKKDNIFHVFPIWIPRKIQEITKRRVAKLQQWNNVLGFIVEISTRSIKKMRRWFTGLDKLSLSILTIGLLTGLLWVVNLSFASSSNDIFRRWPPTLIFLLSSLGLVILIWKIILWFQDLKNFPWTRTLLLVLGQNAFALFVTHTFLLYVYQLLKWPLLNSPLAVFAVWIGSLWLAIYLAKIIPLNLKFNLTLIKWCECQLSDCYHAHEHQHVKLFKKGLIKIFEFKNLFNIQIKGRKLRLIKKRQFAIGMIAVLFSVATLGVADNYQLTRTEVSKIKGNLNRKWLLTECNINPCPSLKYRIQLAEDLQPNEVEVVLENNTKTTVYKFPAKNIVDKKNTWQVDLPNLDLDAGVYDIYAVLNFYGLSFSTEVNVLYVSEPIYVTWTIDWEGYDVNDKYLEALNEIANKYKIPMTQLFNPRIFVTAYSNEFETNDYEIEIKSLPISTDKKSENGKNGFSAIDVEIQENSVFSGLRDVKDPARAEYLTDWVKQRRNTYGDEIGLHLHMFPDLVLDAKVEAKLQPVWGGGWTKGYDVLTTAYSYEDMVKILNRAKGWFVSQDLGIPKSYRAGGWFANEITLKALEATNFLIDSSGRTKYSFGLNNVQGPWNLQVTTQPYYPSMNDQNIKGEENESLQILEIPNNGGDTFAFSAQEMISRFEENFDGQPLFEPKQITYLTHPHWFYPDRQNKIRQVFDHVQKWSYELDRGPVVYTTLIGVHKGIKTFKK